MSPGGAVRVAEWLWENPVLQREWRRRPHRETSRETIAGWMGVVVLLAFYAAAADFLSRQARTPWEARLFPPFVCLIYLVWVSVVVPGPTAARISGERERQTWQALRLTALRPSQIVAGKYLAALWPAVAALILCLPPLVMGAHAARLPASRLLLLLAVLLASPAAGVAVTLWLSARCRQTRVAVALSYFLVGAAFWGALAWSVPLFVHGENLWWYVSPIWHVAVLCLSEPHPSPLARPLLPEWAWFLLGCGTVTFLALALLTRRVAARDEP
jgi:ABC-type Na+ efflux pump permease subunit